MSGPKSRNKKRSSSKLTHDLDLVRARMRRLKQFVVACPVVYLALAGSVGNQDILSLINERKAESPRWMMALEPGNFATKLAPKITLGDTAVPDYASAPVLMLASADKNFQATPVMGMEQVVASGLPKKLPDTIRTNTSAKSDRLITLAPDRQMVDRAAGNLYAMSSLISTEKNNADLPRVAFVKAQPLDSRQSSMLAAAGAEGLLEGGPLDLQKVMMARNAAAASFSLVSAYAPESVRETKEPFDALFGAAKYEQELPPPEDPENPHWWAQKPLPLSVGEKKEQRCLAEAIYFEARGESEDGQTAVAQVVLNRVKNPAYPDTICGVVYQNRHKRNRCQFSFACDGIKDRISSPIAWRTAQRLAREVLNGEHYSKMVDASTHYHATYVNPRWARSMAKRGQVGLHIFYKTYAGGW
ncbi:cell wall hydrolase [Rhodobacterales bacterium]|nr:cell wall hydrolase [Rhodobacterales bacterium]